MISKKVTKIMDGFSQVESLQKEAFPPNESYSIEKILELAKSEHIEYMSFWEDEGLCGILFYNVGETMVYLFYLAVNQKLRSKGYGGKLLTWLKESYTNKIIVGNIEPTGLHSDNEEQRVRRLHFYERNGFHLIPYRLSDDSGLYDIISTGSDSDFNANEYLLLIAELGFDAYRPCLLEASSM